MIKKELIDGFFSDPDVFLLMELIRQSDNPFSTLSEIENQHSNILSWLLTPVESHGQGDLIIKDFLFDVYSTCERGVYGKGGNRDFSGNWDPGKISLSNFSSSVVFREYRFDDNSRIDILLLDTANKIGLWIENKAGTRHKREQLEKYYRNIQTLKKTNFRDFVFSYIALDVNYSSETNDSENGIHEEHERWLKMGYSWLTRTIDRMDRLGATHSHSVQFIRSYCARNKIYDGINFRSMTSRLAREISSKHHTVVDELTKLQAEGDGIRAKLCGSGKLNPVQPDFQLPLFYMQNKSLCTTLIDNSGLWLFDAKIEALKINECDIDRHRSYFAYRVPGGDKVTLDDDGYWPLYIYVSKKDNGFVVRAIALPYFSEKYNSICHKIFDKVIRGKTNRTPCDIVEINQAIEIFKNLRNKIMAAFSHS